MSVRLASRYRETARECEEAAEVIRGMLLSGLPPNKPLGDDPP